MDLNNADFFKGTTATEKAKGKSFAFSVRILVLRNVILLAQ